MKVSFRAGVFVGFALAILLSALSGLTSYRIFRKQAAQRLYVSQSRYALDSARKIQALLTDMETGRRGFRATSQQRFLQPYNSGLQNIQPAIAGLKTLVAGDSEQENRAVMLQEHIKGIISFWENNGDDSGGYSKDIITKVTDDEKRQMDEIRSINTELQKKENELLLKRREEYNNLIHDGTLSTTIGSILSEITIVILLYFIYTETQKRKKVREQLAASVAELKMRTDLLQTSELELRDALKEVESINKQLERFVYTVAHDIKSPMAGVSGALSILEADKAIAADPELAKFVALSYQQTIHISTMINSILEYSRVSLGKQQVEIVNTKQLAEEIAVLMLPPQNIHIAVADTMPVFKTKRIKIMEVFQNLLSNAIKYSNKEEGYIEIGCTENETYYEFYVKDNGRGIPPENKPRIFSLFRDAGQGSARETSTGFGLNIVKLIVEEQGGKIWVDSVPGEGSIFYFEWKK